MDVTKKISMSLDDVIQGSKKESKPQSQKRHTGGFKERNHDNRSDRNNNKFQSNRTFNDRPPKRDFVVEKKAGKTKLKVENLHYNVTNDEVNDLFGSVGKLKFCKIDWDDLGRSKETATVIYHDQKSAEEAIQQYNDAELDGKALKVRFADERDERDRNLPKIRTTGKFKSNNWRR